MSDARVDVSELYRSLPNMDELLKSAELAAAITAGDFARDLVVRCAREQLDALRADIASGARTHPVELAEVVASVCDAACAAQAPSLRRVINATGIVIHTNLGRSVLPDTALAEVLAASQGYSNLEYDVDAGKRGSRTSHIEPLLCEITGAQAALAVNNNAAAVLLALAALATGKETIVSRGQLVEIGGSFRIPDVMAASGTTMIEVGTTNKTHLRDYARAISERTGLLFKAHTSNYQLVGFTEEVSLAGLVELGRERGIPVVEDLGSGVLIDLSAYGLPAEPTVQVSLAAGADVVTFSGDKLLGGPQAGIVCGTREVIDRLRVHPLMRALRLDKMTLAALEATLRLYRDPVAAVRAIPVLRMLTKTQEQCRQDAIQLADALREQAGGCGLVLTIEVADDASLAGGGSLPGTEIPTAIVALTVTGCSAAQLEQQLRALPVPVVARVHDDRLILDVRTLSAADIEVLLSQTAALFPSLSASNASVDTAASIPFASQPAPSSVIASEAEDQARQSRQPSNAVQRNG